MEEGRHGGCGSGGSMVDEGLERVEGVGVMCSFLEFSFTGEVSRGEAGGTCVHRERWGSVTRWKEQLVEVLIAAPTLHLLPSCRDRA